MERRRGTISAGVGPIRVSAGNRGLQNRLPLEDLVAVGHIARSTATRSHDHAGSDLVCGCRQLRQNSTSLRMTLRNLLRSPGRQVIVKTLWPDVTDGVVW